MQLGAGRERKEDVVDPAAGIVLHVGVGDKVEAGTTLATLHTNKSDASTVWERALRDAVTLGSAAVAPEPLVLGMSAPQPAFA